MSDFKTALESLLPDGAIWKVEPDSDLDKLYTAMGLTHADLYEDIKKLAYIRDPLNTPILEDLEREYGVLPDDNLTEAVRRQRLTAIVYARRGSGTIDYLRQRLLDAGFDSLQVHENSPAIDPNEILDNPSVMQAGEALAQAGEPLAQAGYFVGELIVNGDIFNFTIDFIAIAGDTLSQAGEPGMVAGEFSGTTRTLIEYTLPDLGPWPIFYEPFYTPQSVAHKGGIVYDVETTPQPYKGNWPFLAATHDPGNNRTLDISVLANHAYFSPTPPTKIGTKRGYTFNGSSNYMDSSTTAFEVDKNNPLSVLFSGIQNISATGQNYLINNINLTTNRGFLLYSSTPGTLDCGIVSDTPDSINVSYTVGSAVNNFFTLVVTYDGSSSGSGLKLYFNGVLVAIGTGTIAGNTQPTGLPLRFGAYALSPGNYYYGDIYFAAYTSTELSASEVMDLHCKALQGYKAV